MIFQEPMSSLNPVFSVGFQIGEALREHRGCRAPRRARAVLELLEEVGLATAAQARCAIRSSSRAASSSAS